MEAKASQHPWGCFQIMELIDRKWPKPKRNNSPRLSLALGLANGVRLACRADAPVRVPS